MEDLEHLAHTEARCSIWRNPLIRHALAQAQMLLILAFYFRNYYINCTLVELKASNFIRDIGMVRLPTVAIYDFA